MKHVFTLDRLERYADGRIAFCFQNKPADSEATAEAGPLFRLFTNVDFAAAFTDSLKGADSQLQG